MSVEYIFSQIFAVINYIFLGLTYSAKNRKWVICLHIGSVLANGVSFVLLSAWSALAMMVVTLVRNIVFLVRDKYRKTDKTTAVDWAILSTFILAFVVCGVITYEGFLSLFSIFATLLLTISVWQKNIKVFRLMGIFVSIFWLTYYVFINSIFAIVCEAILMIVEIITTIIAFKKPVANREELSENEEELKVEEEKLSE